MTLRSITKRMNSRRPKNKKSRIKKAEYQNWPISGGIKKEAELFNVNVKVQIRLFGILPYVLLSMESF